MKRLAKKEAVSIYELIVAFLCFAAYTLLTLNMKYPFDMIVFWYQAALFATGFFTILFSLSTWFYRSQVHETHRQVYIFCLIVLWLLPIAVLLTDLLFVFKYAGDVIMDFNKDIWDNSVLAQFTIAAVLGYVICGLLFLLDILLTIKLVIKWYRNRKNDTE